MPDEMWNSFSEIRPIPSVTLRAQNGRSEIELVKECCDTFRFECNIQFDSRVRTAGIILRQNSDTGEGFQFLLHIPENRMIFEKTPNLPWYQCMNIGLERPVLLSADRVYHLRLIFDESIVTLYIDDIVLSSRAFDHPGDAVSVFCTEGELEITEASYGAFS